MILAISIPCWLWPLLTGLLCGILGYLLGKLLAKEWREKVAKLENDLDACKKARISLETQVNTLQSASTSSVDIDQWKNRVSSLEANLKSGHETKAKLDVSVSRLQEKTTQLENDLVIAKNKLKETSVVKDEPVKISEDAEHWKNKATDLQTQLVASKTKVNELERALESEKSKVKSTIENTSAIVSSLGATAIAFDADLAKTVLGRKIKQDDLTIVEGIGPKIQGLFHEHGVKTWLALSQCTVEKCQEVLDSGGPRYRMHNPRTWAKQAEFAYKGEWEALKKWQDELDGGN